MRSLNRFGVDDAVEQRRDLTVLAYAAASGGLAEPQTGLSLLKAQGFSVGQNSFGRNWSEAKNA